MRLIALATLSNYWAKYPSTETSLRRWAAVVKVANWQTLAEVQDSFSKAKALGSARVRFPVAGGDHRLVAAFDFQAQIVFLKFIGTHVDYDRVDALTVSLF